MRITKCENLGEDDYCEKARKTYDYDGAAVQCGLGCPYDGDAQKCLDTLKSYRKGGISWEKFAATKMKEQQAELTKIANSVKQHR